MSNNKRSASDMKVPTKSSQGGPSDAKKLKVSKSEDQWVSRSSQKGEVSNPLVKKEVSRARTRRDWKELTT